MNRPPDVRSTPMAEDPQPGPADDQPEENEPEPYRLRGAGKGQRAGHNPRSGGTAGSGSGVNWEVTKDTARKTAASLGADPTPDSGQQRALADAVSLAELWLDQATTFPRVSATVAAWSRAEWIEQTLPVWRRLF